jgi:hypothetical protein
MDIGTTVTFMLVLGIGVGLTVFDHPVLGGEVVATALIVLREAFKRR